MIKKTRSGHVAIVVESRKKIETQNDYNLISPKVNARIEENKIATGGRILPSEGQE
jgi:hypothetical protein